MRFGCVFLVLHRQSFHAEYHYTVQMPYTSVLIKKAARYKMESKWPRQHNTSKTTVNMVHIVNTVKENNDNHFLEFLQIKLGSSIVRYI